MCYNVGKYRITIEIINNEYIYKVYVRNRMVPYYVLTCNTQEACL